MPATTAAVASMLSNNTSSNSPNASRAGTRSSASSPKGPVKTKSGKSLQGNMVDHVEIISDTEEDDSNKSSITSKSNNAEHSHRRSSSSPRGLKNVAIPPNPIDKEPSSHNSRRNRRSSTETENATRDGRGNDRSLRRSQSGKGLAMAGGHSPVPSSSEQKSRRSKRTTHTAAGAGAQSPQRDGRSIRKPNSMGGGSRRMVESSNPVPTGNSTRRSRRTSDATDSLSSDNTKGHASMRISKSHQGLGMSDASPLSIKNSNWSSRRSRRSSDNTKGSTSPMRKSKSLVGLQVADLKDDATVSSKNSNWSSRSKRRSSDNNTKDSTSSMRKSKSYQGLGMVALRDDISASSSKNSNWSISQNNRRSSDITCGTPIDPRKQRRRRSNSASRRITRSRDDSQSSLNMSSHSKKSLGMKDEPTVMNSSATSMRKQRRRRSNSSSRRITRTEDEPPERMSNSLNMSSHTTKSPVADESRISATDSVSIRKQRRRRSNSASRRLTRCRDEGSPFPDEKNNLSISSHSKMSHMKDGSAMNCSDPRKQRRRRSKSASKRLSQRIQDEQSTASDEKSSLTMSIPSQMNSPDPRNQRRRRSNSASKRLSQRQDELSISSSNESTRNGNRQLGTSEPSRRASENSRRPQKVIDDNTSRRRRGKSGTRLSDNGNASTRSRSKSGLRSNDNDVNRSNRSRSKSGLRLPDDESRGRQKESTLSKPPRSRSKVSLVDLPKDPTSDMSLHLHTTGSVSSLSAGTARPRVKKKPTGSGESKERSKRSRSANRILEEPTAVAGATLPRKSSAESYLHAKVDQDKSNNEVNTRETHNNYAYDEPVHMVEKESQEQLSSKSGKRLKPARRPQIPRQGRKQSIDNSISSLTICSRFHSDDLSLASSQRSQLRRAFSSPKLYFDGPYGSSFRSHREEDDDDESFACEKPTGSVQENSRWKSRAPERNETAPTIPEHGLSRAGSNFGHPNFTRHASGEGRWSDSTTFSGAPRSSDPDSPSGLPDYATPIRHQNMPPVSGHSRSMNSSYGYEPNTPSQSMQSVQTGVVSELTPGTFGGSHTGFSRVSDYGEFGSWMSSMHSLVLHDERGYPEYHEYHEYEPSTTHQKCDTLPRIVRRHSFDSVNILCDNSVGNDSEKEVRSVKSGFTTLMKYDGENDSLPQKPNRRESTGFILR